MIVEGSYKDIANLFNSTSNKKDLFYKVIINFAVCESNLKHGIDPLLYKKNILSLHKAVCLTLGFNPNHYKIPDNLNKEYWWMVEEVREAHLCNKLLLLFKGNELPKDPNYVLVDMQQFREWVSNNKEFLPTKYIEAFLKKLSIQSKEPASKEDKRNNETNNFDKTCLKELTPLGKGNALRREIEKIYCKLHNDKKNTSPYDIAEKMEYKLKNGDTEVVNLINEIVVGKHIKWILPKTLDVKPMKWKGFCDLISKIKKDHGLSRAKRKSNSN